MSTTSCAPFFCSQMRWRFSPELVSRPCRTARSHSTSSLHLTCHRDGVQMSMSSVGCGERLPCPTSLLRSPSALSLSYRHFLFGWGSKKLKEESVSLSKSEEVSSSASSPLREDAVAPLQDRLLHTCVQLLEMAGGSADGRPPLVALDNTSKEVFFDLVDAVLHDYTKTPAQQFEMVYIALCLPAAQQHAFIRRSLLMVLEAVAPPPLFQFMVAVDLSLPDYDEESVAKRAAFTRWTRALMGGLEETDDGAVLRRYVTQKNSGSDASTAELNDEEGLSEEELLLVYVDDFKKAFPHAVKVPAFETLEKHAVEISLKSKLYTLLGNLCHEMDRERSGKVSLEELQHLAKRVLGEAQAKELLEGAVGDEQGKIRYAQLCAILTKPRIKAVAS